MLKREDILHREKLSLILHMKHRQSLTIAEFGGKAKNVRDSVKHRDMGNELYKQKLHDSSIHKDICCEYSWSIALAPNNSKELALGYGNRSAFLFHIKKYKECITDIDRALKITSNDLLKEKLLCRKADSLAMLNKSTKLPKQGSFMRDLLNFERSEEIPSVSKSIALKYNKKWGHHVVATEDIKPGEIISVQKWCFACISYKNIHLTCSYCQIMVFNSLPCEFCIYASYCSEECQSKAWEEYHQYECVIYQHSNAILFSILHLQFVLSTIYEVGSIEQMQEYILEIENTIDPRTKGFSNGILYTEQKKNLYILNKICEESLDYKFTQGEMQNICNSVYLLAKFTNFFGDKTNVQEPEVLLNEDRLFIAALILRTCYIIKRNIEKFSHTTVQTPESTDLSVTTFNSLINHNCFSNVETVNIIGGKNITFASHPIKKGCQLFRSFNGVNIFVPKTSRQILFNYFNITCECIACIEDWSTISLPSMLQLLEVTPTLDVLFLKNTLLLERLDPRHGFLRFNQTLLYQVCHHLADIAKKFTVACEDYHLFLQFIKDLIFTVFSNRFEMPAQCE